MRLRVVVANIQSGIGITRGYRQYLTSGWRYFLPHKGHGITKAGAFLLSEKTDIALLTEVDGGSRRSKHSSQTDLLANDSALTERRFFTTRIVGTAVHEGNAVLTSFPITTSRAYPLASRINPRVLGETVLDINGESITVFVAHLGLGSKGRVTQIAELAERIRATDGPIILGGDFNERDHRAFKPLLKAGLTAITAPNYPSWKPRYALQVLFVSEHFKVLEKHVSNVSLFSDHLPLVVELERV